MPVAIRVNGVGTEWHSLDLDAVAQSDAAFVVVPRAISAHLVHGVGEAVGKPVLAMIETAAGVLSAAEIAGVSAGLIAGTNDLRSDLRLPLDADRHADFGFTTDDCPCCAGFRRGRIRWSVQRTGRRGRLPARGRGRAATRFRREEPHPPESDRALPPRLCAERRRDRACPAAGAKPFRAAQSVSETR